MIKNFTRLSVCIAILALFATGHNVHGQGCVAVRNMSSTCSAHPDSVMEAASWQLSMNYRYFHSFRHFRGSHEEANRVEDNTEVINNDHSVLVGIAYIPNQRWSFSAIIPVMYIDRSSLYEHKGNSSGERYHTQSKGLGDIRLAGYYSVIPNSHKGSLTFGLGTKLPTGNYNYKDVFQRPDGPEELPVDQSIQPGDGGWGITTEFDASLLLANNIYAYASGLYLFNPRNTNGTTSRNREFSVVDQYLVRLGGRYTHGKLQASVGGRMECIPVYDLLGDSDGFRRPGYIISVEPAAFYTIHHKHTIGFNFPIALVRNRTQSVLDKQRTRETGEYSHGDAAFADWLLSVSYAYRF